MFSAHPEIKQLSDLLKTVSAGDVIKSKPAQGLLSVDEKESVFQAITKMSENNLGAIMIRGSSNPISGMFTERDYLYKLILEGKASKETPIKEVMTTPVFTVEPSHNLDECSAVMAKKCVRHLPVVSLEGSKIREVFGVLSAKDIIRKISQIAPQDLPVLNESVSEVYDYLARGTSEECYISQDQTVYKALEKMKAAELGGLFVTKGQELVGIFTERDYLTKIALQGRSSKTTKVKEVMNRNIVFVAPTTKVGECISLMAGKGVQMLPVAPVLGYTLNDAEKDELIGMITYLDIIQFLESETEGGTAKGDINDILGLPKDSQQEVFVI